MIIDALGKIKEDHIFHMTDDTGMFQHCKYGVPDPTKGYTTDDNARALIMAVMLYHNKSEEKYLKLIYTYTSFLLNAQNDEGKFKNFMNYDRQFIEKEGSEDCFGRCLWALGYTVSDSKVPNNIKLTCKHMLTKALKNCAHIKFLRGKAYSIIGLQYIDDPKKYIRPLAESILEKYNHSKDEKWKWYEDDITYSNSILPWSMFVGYEILGEEKFLDCAEESLKFLENITFKNWYYKPVGCNGWLNRGEETAKYDEQPVEAAETSLTYITAYKLTNNIDYLNKAKQCHAWYKGENSKGKSLVDSENGGCYDGITENGMNLNEGAESLVSYFISSLALNEYIDMLS